VLHSGASLYADLPPLAIIFFLDLHTLIICRWRPANISRAIFGFFFILTFDLFLTRTSGLTHQMASIPPSSVSANDRLRLRYLSSISSLHTSIVS